MAAQTTNYQCPACTGPLHYAGASGKLECDYCGSSFTIEEIEKLYGVQNQQAAAAYAQAENTAEAVESGDEWDTSDMQQWYGAGIKAYNCTSCGAELLCDSTTAATECPYCGNPTIIPGQFSGALKPDYVIPFRLDKKAAMDSLKKHYGKKKLLPRLFTEENHVQKIQGVYVPFWLYNGVADADADYSAQRILMRRERDYEVTETHYFDLQRSASVEFENVPVNGSSKMPDDLMESLEPYDYSELKPFSMSYLPGYLADNYDENAEECSERADKRAERTVAGVLERTTDGYVNVQTRRRDVRLRRGKVHYALMPVWILNTRWEDKNYVFAMNGQTGKFIGDLPMDNKLYWKYHLINTGIIGAIAYVLVTLSKLF